jgi:tRNA isopentenyl-2-thiomethyl-A-37 hydroxylase MiaE
MINAYLTDLDNKILNQGMELAMEFGKNWLMPIQDRLGKKHKRLNREELDHYEKVCRKALEYGIKQVKVQCKPTANGVFTKVIS